MENEKLVEINTNNISNENSMDIIIKKLQELNLYLKTDNNCQMLLKLSEQELQNEIKFKSRAEKIQKYHHKYDQIILEKDIINELQQSINSITNNLNMEIGKEKLEPKTIMNIYDKIMILKMLDIKNVKSLEASIKLNKMTLKEITKLEKEINDVRAKLSPKDIPPKKSDTQVKQILNNSRDHKLSVSLSNVSRRNDRDGRVYPRTRVEHVRRFGSTTNDDIIIIDPQTYTNDTLRTRIEMDHTRIVENFITQSNTEQNTRFRNTEDWSNHNLMLLNINDDAGEFSSLNSTVNLNKENEDNSNGDVLLILQPPNVWTDV